MRLTRNQEIVALFRSEPYTMARVGEHFGVSRERVRQILAVSGVTSEEIVARREARAALEIDAKRQTQRQNQLARKKLRRLHQHQHRLQLIAMVRTIAAAVGHTPTMGELREHGVSVPGAFMYFVGRSAHRHPPYGKIGLARLYRLAGLRVRPPGFHGSIRNFSEEQTDVNS